MATETSDHAIETMFLEERTYPPPEDFAAQANAQPDIYDVPFEEFWEREGRERVTWFEPFSELYEWEPPYAKWYLGGKLNVCFNCVDRHVEAGARRQGRVPLGGRAGRRDAHDHVRRPPAGRRPLRERAQEARREEGDAGRDLHGHGPGAAGGDARVHPARRAAHRRLRRLLGRLALGPDERHEVRGAHHAGRGVAARLEGRRSRRSPTRRWPTRPACRAASSSAAPAATCRCRTGRDHWWHDLESDVSDDPESCPCEPMDSEDLLFLMYTSGTTGEAEGDRPHDGRLPRRRRDDAPLHLRPEAGRRTSTGAPPTSAGSPATATSSTGRSATGRHVGPLRGDARLPRQGPLVVDRRAVQGDDPLHGADGDPLAHEVGAGVRAEARSLVAAPARLGRRADQPGGVGLVPRAHRRRPDPDRRHLVADGDRDDPDHAAAGHHDAQAGLGDAAVPRRRCRRSTTSRATRSAPAAGGYLVLKRPWPAMLRGIFGDDQRYRDTYWSKYEDIYLAGDGARIDQDGDYWLLGRIDDVMNVSGHRISTIEVESALVDHQEVAEAAVCSRADAGDGRGDRRVRDAEGRSARAPSRSSRSCATTSRRRSGRSRSPRTSSSRPSCRRRAAARSCAACCGTSPNNRQLGDTTTLADPTVVDEISKRATDEKAQEAEA